MMRNPSLPSDGPKCGEVVDRAESKTEVREVEEVAMPEKDGTAEERPTDESIGKVEVKAGDGDVVAEEDSSSERLDVVSARRTGEDQGDIVGLMQVRLPTLLCPFRACPPIHLRYVTRRQRRDDSRDSTRFRASRSTPATLPRFIYTHVQLALVCPRYVTTLRSVRTCGETKKRVPGKAGGSEHPEIQFILRAE